MTIIKSILTGTFWTALGTYINLILTIMVTAILSRLLDAEDFGIVGMVYIYSGFMSIIASSGLNSTIVQKQDLNDNELSTVFWYSVFLGLSVVLFSFYFAPKIEHFFNYPGLKYVVQVMSINLLILGFSNVPFGILRKRLSFRRIALIDIFSAFSAGLAAISLAYYGSGYWSLVIQSLIFASFKALGYFWCAGWVPRFSFRFQTFISIFGYSNYLLGFNSINYWARNADNLLIGKFFGAEQLGFYNQAYKLMVLPIRIITNAVTPALHPIFAGIQDDIATIKTHYFQVLEIIALFSVPLGAYFIIYGDILIRILWGENFIQSIPIFRILALLTMSQPLVSSSGSIFMSCNKAGLMFRLGVFNALVMISGILIGSLRGSVGVAVGYAVSYLTIVFPLTFFFLVKILEAQKAELFRVFVKPFILGLTLLISLLLIKISTSDWISVWMSFMVSFCFSLIFFIFFVLTVYRELAKKVFCFIRDSNRR